MFTYTAPHFRTCRFQQALSSQTGPAFSLGRSSLPPRSRTFTCVAIQLHVALVCHY